MLNRWLTVFLIAGLLLVLVMGCGKKGDSRTGGTLDEQSRLVLSSKSVREGEELKVTISWTGAEDLYQLSCRLKFDPADWRPVSVEYAGAFGEEAIFFSDTSQAGFVPLAVTPLLKGEGLSGDGDLATVTFEARSTGAESPRLLDEASFLVARDASKGVIPVVVGGDR